MYQPLQVTGVPQLAFWWHNHVWLFAGGHVLNMVVGPQSQMTNTHCFFSSSLDKPRMTGARGRIMNVLFGCQTYPEVLQSLVTSLQPDWTVIFARLSLQISRGNDLVPSLTYLTRFGATGSVHSPTEPIQNYPLSQSLRRGYKLHVTSHSEDIEQNSGLHEAWTEGSQRWKEAAGCHSDSIVDFSLSLFFPKTQRAPLREEINHAFLCTPDNEGVQAS